jgi:hypothetical protein
LQVIDDVLDYVSSSEEMGKPTSADLKLGLATAPVLFAAEEYPELNRLIARRFSAPGDVERVCAKTINRIGAAVSTVNLFRLFRLLLCKRAFFTIRIAQLPLSRPCRRGSSSNRAAGWNSRALLPRNTATLLSQRWIRYATHCHFFFKKEQGGSHNTWHVLQSEPDQFLRVGWLRKHFLILFCMCPCSFLQVRRRMASLHLPTLFSTARNDERCSPDSASCIFSSHNINGQINYYVRDYKTLRYFRGWKFCESLIKYQSRHCTCAMSF